MPRPFADHTPERHPTRGASPSPSRQFLEAFAAKAGERGVLRFDEYVDLALYDPNCGYYRRDAGRVGYGTGTDFFTASTSGPIFGELVAAACVKLLGPHRAANHTFVEIGAESAGGILEGVAHPFAAARTLRIGETLKLAGPCVVFSNELFDAQPFRRFRFAAGQWRELGVATGIEAGLREVELEGAPAIPELPASAAEGYILDMPLAAARLAAIIGRQPWTGLFIAFDYGKTWRELAEACPAGTARAYYRHTQSNDLLARPGEQDLTCHVCWDWLEESLRRGGLSDVSVSTQETFLMRHADAYIARAIAEDAAKFTPRKQSLMQLLHGSHLGQRFQVLSGHR